MLLIQHLALVCQRKALCVCSNISVKGTVRELIQCNYLLHPSKIVETLNVSLRGRGRLQCSFNISITPGKVDRDVGSNFLNEIKSS